MEGFGPPTKDKHVIKAVSQNFKLHLTHYPPVTKKIRALGRLTDNLPPSEVRGLKEKKLWCIPLARLLWQQGSSLVLNQTNINKENQLLLQ